MEWKKKGRINVRIDRVKRMKVYGVRENINGERMDVEELRENKSGRREEKMSRKKN